ncbi:MAG TPA: hypothetical protein VH142_05735 [Polyangiaceae bacterium]|nr:hypothetical protein [Polyangiaceae bacterium]
MSIPSRPPIDSATERAERAGRVAAMLDRWAAEETSGEPEWDVEDFDRVDFTRSLGNEQTTATPKP